MAEFNKFNPKQVAVVIPHYRETLNEDEQFHHAFVDGLTGGLDEENIMAADVILDFAENLSIGEIRNVQRSQGLAKIFGNTFSKTRIGASSENFHDWASKNGDQKKGIKWNLSYYNQS